MFGVNQLVQHFLRVSVMTLPLSKILIFAVLLISTKVGLDYLQL